jgi:flavin-dependent dehydrogenase
MACDTLTGEGIGQALVTGREAATAILDNPDDFERVAARYVSAVRADLVADHKMAQLLGKLLAKPRIAEAALRVVGTNDWTRRNFGRWMFEDYPRAIIATPRRWRRGVLSSPGAQV